MMDFEDDFGRRLTQILKSYVSSPHISSIELEARLGTINIGNTHFVTGIPNDQVVYVTNLLQSLSSTCENEENWTQKPQTQYISASFPSGIRRQSDCVSDKAANSEFVRKKVIRKVDSRTNRHFDVRIALCEETKLSNSVVSSLSKLLNSPPQLLRVIQRASFSEQWTRDVQFIYDISRITCPNSKSCEAQYEIELEMVINAPPRTDQLPPYKTMAGAFAGRISTLLGTHQIQSDTGKLEPLPKVIYKIVHN